MYIDRMNCWSLDISFRSFFLFVEWRIRSSQNDRRTISKSVESFTIVIEVVRIHITTNICVRANIELWKKRFLQRHSSIFCATVRAFCCEFHFLVGENINWMKCLWGWWFVVIVSIASAKIIFSNTNSFNRFWFSNFTIITTSNATWALLTLYWKDTMTASVWLMFCFY